SAGAGASFSAGAFAGSSGSAVFSAGATYTAGARFPASGGGPAFSANVWSGAQASAGVPALMGAFAGLRTTPPPPPPRVDVSRLLRQVSGSSIATGASATFELGGQIRATGGQPRASLTTRTRIRFFED
ncbi:MAG TPA: hypothetical protein VND93_24450, partial [Myxococcales bacterium]|nr:hypothetical protein [Myxococcales bacterium]